MKNRIISVILLIALTLSVLASCSEYKPPVGGGGQNIKPGETLDDDPTNDFTVSLRLNGELFIPSISIDVYWADENDVFVAPIGSDGVARVDGLDGDYRVTLSSIPSTYGYNANGYTATNYERNIVIDVYDLAKVTNSVDDKPSSLNGCIEISKTGVYSVTISEPGERVYFEYAPEMNGVYTVESWVSTSEDLINPIAYKYDGSTAYKFNEQLVTSLGEVGSFTRNFIHTVRIADENISSAGQVTFTFALTAEPKDGMYPVTYNFAIKRDGGFDSSRRDKTMVPVTDAMEHFDFDAFNGMAGGTLVGAETLFEDEFGNPKPGAYVFDDDKYRLWEAEDGGDGVYHVYDPDKYPETGGYGPILVAYITVACDFVDKAFTEIEYVGNSALTVNGYENHKQFIEGYAALASQGYYCVDDCPCHRPGDTYKACPTGCPNCKRQCTNVPADMIGQAGYASRANADGVVAVTQELAEFLQKFAVSQRYFADGDGWAEKGSNPIYAYEDGQWLFACAYYQD
jgi:hypothetical protein